ncbi:MAG: Flp pilus assembly protein CpaB [Chloroflexi bacterium]|nr:Flp pilus assembly protein CpaB [Chloroflexota bacterium]
MRRIFNGSMLIAVLLAVAGGGLAYMVMSGEPASAGVEQRPLVVFARDVSIGARITSADVRVEESPAAGILGDNAATDIDQVVGKFALLPVVVGEPVLLVKLADSQPGSSLAALIPPGRVAVSVAVNDVIRTGGFIAPGDRVDVYGVVTDDPSDVAQLVLADITVLAVSRTAVGDDLSDPRSTGRDNPRSLDATVTLAVTSEEARRLVQVDEVGKLRLALRPRVAIGGTP